MTNVKQMLTALAENQVISPIVSEDEVGPALTIETTAADSGPAPTLKRKATRLTSLLVAEFSGDVPEEINGLVTVYMTIDDARFGPIFPVRIGAGAPRAHFSFLAFKDHIQPGEHVVTVKWRTIRTPAVFIGVRTLTVWETLVDVERPEVLALP